MAIPSPSRRKRSGLARSDRLRRQRQHRHRRQRQLDRLPAGRDDRRHAQRDRSCDRRPRRPPTRAARPPFTAPGADRLVGRRQRLVADLDRHQCRSQHHRHRQRAVRARSRRQPGNRNGLQCGPHGKRRRHQRQDLDLLLLQRRHRGQCHLRRRHRRYGQDARSVERRAAGQQPDRDARLHRQADDLGHQRLRFLDPRVGGGGRLDRRHRHQRADLLDRLGAGRRQFGAGRSQQPGDAVQQHPGPDHHHGPGCFVQRRQPARLATSSN